MCQHKEDAGRVVFGVFAAVFYGASAAYFVSEFGAMETLDLPAGAPDNTSASLVWADLGATVVGVLGALAVLMPEFCCGRGSESRVSFRRERFFVALLFLGATVIVSMTSRVRDNNINAENQNENFVCSRRDAPDACPTSRVKLSEAFRLWGRVNDAEDECWYNVSAPFPESFVWGEEYEFSGAYPTADFSDPQTYERFDGKYAPCFWWGCGCLPSQSAMQERLLRFEVLVQAISLAMTVLSLCLQSRYDEKLIVVKAYEYEV